MAEEADIDSLRVAVGELTAAVRETNESTRMLVEATRGRDNSSNITIDAGGWTSGVALGGFVLLIVMFMLFATWVIWQVSESKSQQEAWIQVWQQRVAEATSRKNPGD